MTFGPVHPDGRLCHDAGPTPTIDDMTRPQHLTGSDHPQRSAEAAAIEDAPDELRREIIRRVAPVLSAAGIATNRVVCLLEPTTTRLDVSFQSSGRRITGHEASAGSPGARRRARWGPDVRSRPRFGVRPDVTRPRRAPGETDPRGRLKRPADGTSGPGPRGLAAVPSEPTHGKEFAMSVVTSRGSSLRVRRRLPEAAPPLDADGTLVDLFFDRVARWSDRPALRYRHGDVWEVVSWAGYGTAVQEVAAALVTLGLQPGDRAGILAGNQPRWHMVDVGIMAAGGVTVPAYPTGAASQVAHVLGHSDSRVCFVGDRDQLAKLLLCRPRLPALERIVMLGDPPDGLDDDLLLTFDDLRSLGRQRLAEQPGVVEERARQLRSDGVATIVYTSGTTGPPKGTMITHENVAETIRSLTAVVSVGPTDRFLSFLPLSHIAERCVSHLGQILSGGETWFARSLATLAEDLRACRPTIFFAVPRVWEKFRQGVEGELGRAPGLVRSPADKLVELGRATVAAAEGDGAPLEWRDRLAYRVLDRTLGARIRRQLGLDRARIYVSVCGADRPRPASGGFTPSASPSPRCTGRPRTAGRPR